MHRKRAAKRRRKCDIFLSKGTLVKWFPLLKSRSLAHYQRAKKQETRFFHAPPEYGSHRLLPSARTALVVGNGPSLTQVSPSEFDVETIFLCNYAHRLNSAWVAAADNLVIDPHGEYWGEQVIQSGASMRRGANIYLSRSKDRELPPAWDHVAVKRIWTRRNLLDGYGCPKPASQLGKIESESLFYRYRHTPMLSIQVALFLGYRRIILVGLDHDHVVAQLTKKQPRVSHAYIEDAEAQEIMPKQTYLALAEEIRLTWGMYAALNNLAENYEAQILDATRGGQLDVFPKLVGP